MCPPGRLIPCRNFQIWIGRHFERVEKNFNFSTRDPDHLHACGSRVYGAIFSKNRFFGTTHGDKPVSQNGISLRSPSLIMAPGDNQILFCLTQKYYFHVLQRNLKLCCIFKNLTLIYFKNEGSLQIFTIFIFKTGANFQRNALAFQSILLAYVSNRAFSTVIKN